MANPIEYIVFEPDQVLTNDHLNETFNYLDQQNRWTRNKLIGIGIVCGLEIVLNTGVIEITEGCGITSQGYLINCDMGQYTHYIPYSPVDIPGDLPFSHGTNLPFFKPFCTGRKVWLLLTDDDYNALDGATQLTAPTISSSTNFLQDYVVVLFLEAKETDLKNCNMLDCNNSGATMAFTLRPLLVAISDLADASLGSTGLIRYVNLNLILSNQVNLKRFNVPYAALNTSNDVLNAFVSLVDDTTLTQLSNACNNCYQQYSGMLNLTTNPFESLLSNLQSYRKLVLTQNPVFIQYFYDFVDDLIKAFNEFSAKARDITGTCCPDENLFPLHLILGLASQATNPFVHDSYRNYFMYSSMLSQTGETVTEAMLLFNRMVIMVNKFTVQSQALQLQASLKITPGRYEFAWLSERAIPYYYQVNASGAELYKYWNYDKTSHGNAGLNLSYNANLYSSNTAVTQPLLYDIEKYNFFRIEGHIGQNFSTVLSNLLNQRMNYNLPFDVVAVSADQLQSDAPLPQCSMQDLETDYKLIVSEAACKIHSVFCFVTKLPYKVVASSPTRKAETNLYEIPKTSTLKFTAFKLEAAKPDILLVNLSTIYKKGDFMRKYCAPLPNTIGSAYLNAIDSTGKFTNPVQVNQSNSLTAIYYYFFEFVDAVEELMYVLQTDTLDQLDMTAFDAVYQTYLKDTALAMDIIVGLTAKKTSNTLSASDTQSVTLAEDMELDLLVDEMGLLTTMCLDDRLQVLADEYKARITQYQQQLTFLNYYKNHPGLEHKAGVPKGGTFVLVYHSGTTDTSVTTTAGSTDSATQAATAVPLMEEMVAKPDTVAQTTASFDENTIKLITGFVNDCNDAPPATKQKILGILNKVPPRRIVPTYSIPDGAIIADFYIPYLCCSDCPPVAYVIPAPQVKPVVTMATIFCDSNTNAEPIQVSEPNGTFNKIPGLKGGSNPTFTPSVAGAGPYQVIYTVNGVASDPVDVTVIPMPASTFSIKNNGVTGKDGFISIDVTFTADAQPDPEADYSYQYKWKFGKGFPVASSTEASPELAVVYSPNDGEISTEVSLTVTAAATGVNCTDKATTAKVIITGNGVFQPEQVAKSDSLNVAAAAKNIASESSITKGIENLFSKKKKKN